MASRPPFRHGPKKKYTYIPPPSSGAHAILVSMYKAEQSELIKNLTKQQVLDYCIRYSQSGLKDTSKIWASMKGLIDKSLVGRHIARDPLYYLLDEGRDLAHKLTSLGEPDDETNINRFPQDPSRSSHQETNPIMFSQELDSSSNPAIVHDNIEANFELEAGTFDIILVVDQREKVDIVSLDNTVKIETRTLGCGDFIWIARPKTVNSFDRTRDLVLDYVVERKRLDDLASSIFDGRFEQQKQRLLNCGVRRPVYLIEDCGNLRASNLTSSGLAQAVTSILIHDRIDVEKVKNAGHANDYLIGMTKCIEKLYSSETLRSSDYMTFSDFQTKGAKITNWTVREMFAKHLIQIRGVSDKSVAVVIRHYPTLQDLVDAYRSCGNEKDKELLLAKLKIPDSNRTIGPAISKRIYACYGNKTFDQ